MALVLADRVKETAISPGTGAVTLLGATLGFQSFAVVGNGNTTLYTIADQGGNKWEVGIGTYSSTGPTLARTTVLSSSNSNTLVDFNAGVQDVFVTYPSSKSVYLDASNNVNALGTISSGTWNGSIIGTTYGGTNGSASPTAGAVAYGNGSAYAFTSVGMTNQVLISNGSSAPSWADLSSVGVSTFSAGTTGLTPSTGTSGAVTLGGTLATTNGGTGLTGFTAGTAIYASSTSALTSGTLPTTGGGTGLTSFTANQIFFASSSSAIGQSANLSWNGTTLAVTGAFSATADSSFTSTGALTISKGTTGERPSPVSGMLRFNTTSTEFEGYNGTAWASVGGAALTNDTATSTNLFPLFSNATSGTASTLFTSNAKYLYKPSTGELQASVLNASNGIVVNSQTVAASYSIPSGSSAMSTGPVTVASGVTVDIPSGSKWVVL
jgi:hypothetical protein